MGACVLWPWGFAAVRMFPNRQPTLKNPDALHSALQHQSVDFVVMRKA
jgi:hypothetical protein